jgi:hypothetical protein
VINDRSLPAAGRLLISEEYNEEYFIILIACSLLLVPYSLFLVPCSLFYSSRLVISSVISKLYSG